MCLMDPVRAETDTENVHFRGSVMLMKCRMKFYTSKYRFAIALEQDWISNPHSPNTTVKKLKYYY